MRSVMMTVGAGLVAAAILAAGPANANDSAAALGAGGLELVEQADVRMVSEDLTISEKLITVRYSFLNESERDIRTLVAFPLPEVDLSSLYESGVGWPSDNTRDPLGFTVTVDGKGLSPQIVHKAMYKGRDITSELTAAKVPVLFPVGNYWDSVNKVKKADVDRLAAKGYLDVTSQPGSVIPAWTLKSKYFWTQTFPAGRPLSVVHTYKPVVGGSFMAIEGEMAKLSYYQSDEYFRAFCIDQGTLNGLKAKYDRERKKAGQDGTLLVYSDIRYVLKSGANWKGPISRFRMTVDKGKPGHIVSFCGQNVRKSGPAKFEVVKTDFEPTEDIAVLVVRSAEDGE